MCPVVFECGTALRARHALLDTLTMNRAFQRECPAAFCFLNMPLPAMESKIARCKTTRVPGLARIGRTR